MSLRSIARPALAALAFGSVVLTATSSLPQQLPTGGAVTHGAATIGAPQGSTLNINQTSNRAIIDWSSFSVGAGGRVNFNQPGASAATLNRVTGTTSSTIAGAITAPGTVLLVNPNGIAITPTGTVNVGSFAASTLDIKNSDFLAGNYKFTGNGSSAVVTNAGRINVSDGGFAALLGGRVANDGIITARLGKVGLGSGERITLDLSGDGFLQVEVPSNQLGNIVDGTGQALVSNRGKIRADGGIVHLSAATASNILRDAVNVPGSIRANSVGTRGGRIVLGGGTGGRVTVSGRVSASGTRTARGRTPGNGGNIDIAGAEIALVGARLNASGATGGGRIRIGGDAQGSGDFPHARSVSIDSASVIKVDATESGSGGTVIVWSDGHTQAIGTFSARGGSISGDGGLIETSGHSVDFNNVRIDASTSRGKGGKWLIDPTDLTIDGAAAGTIQAALNTGTSVGLWTNPDGTTGGAGVTSPGSGDININAGITWSTGATLYLDAVGNVNVNAVLHGLSGAVVVHAGGSFNVNQTGGLFLRGATVEAQDSISLTGVVTLAGNSASTAYSSSFTARNSFVANQFNLGRASTIDAGSIELRGQLTTYGGATLNSRSSISMRSVVNDGGGTLTLSADTGGTGSGSVYFGPGDTITSSGHVDIFYHPNSYSDPSFFPGVNGGGTITAWKLVSTPAQFAQLNNLSGAQNQFYALNHDIDYTNFTTSVGSCCHQVQNNTQTIESFYGTLDGFGHAILNPRVALLDNEPNWTGGALAALIGTNNGTIRNFGVVGGSFSSQRYNDAAGLVITNNGTLTNVFSTAQVSVSGGRRAGGLVMENNDSGIINGGSYASGNVSVAGNGAGGGLVGINNGIITNTYATGSVGGPSAGGNIGGLVGTNAPTGQITFSYALGTVQANGSGSVGGLVGLNDWVLSTAGSAGRNGAGGLGGRGGGYIANSYAAGRVIGGSYAGGLVGVMQFDNRSAVDIQGNNQSSSTLYWSYWDTSTTGQSKAFGYSYRTALGPDAANFGIGTLTNAAHPTYNNDYINFVGAVGGGDAYQITSYPYFNRPNDPNVNSDTISFNNAWYIIQGQSRPFLRAEFSTNIGNTHQLQLINMNATASYRLMRNIDATVPSGTTSMWATGNFAAISPVSWTAVLTPLNKHIFLGNDINGNPTYFDESLGTLSIETPSQPVSFTGVFDGQDHTISNLNVDAPLSVSSSVRTIQTFAGIDFPMVFPAAYTPSAGLFEWVGAGGVVENVGIVAGQFNAQGWYAGAIAGANNGTILYSYADSATVVQSNTRAGGLVGVNFQSGQIFQSYSSAAVSTTEFVPDGSSGGSSMVGGLVGGNLGLIQDSYATGSARGNGWVGGLVGYNSADAWIVNTYAVGDVNRLNGNASVAYAGRLVGQDIGHVMNSYFNYDSGVTGGVLNPLAGLSGQGYFTSQLQDINTYTTIFAGFNFATVWAPPNQAGQGGLGTAYYPELNRVSHVVAVQAGSATRVYGDSNAAVTANISGVRIYDSVGAVTISTPATQTSDVGDYAFNASIAQGRSADGATYRVVSVPGTLTITQRGLTVTANNQSRVYGASDPSLSYSITLGNLVNGDQLSGALARAAGNNVGTYAINQGSLSAGGNYALTYQAGGTLTITRATLTYAANTASRAYGDANSAFGGTVTGFVNGDTLVSAATGTLSFNGSATATSVVGQYAINGSGLSAGNYVFQQAAGNTTALAVNRRDVTVTANDASREYGLANPALTYGTSSLGAGVAVTGALSTSVTQASDVGQYAIQQGTVANATNANYNIAYVGANLTVNQAELTFAATGSTRAYGDVNPTLGGQITGFRNGQSAQDFGSDIWSSSATATSVIGSYAINGNLASASPNYRLTQAAGNATALTIAQRNIIVAATAASRYYGDNNPGLTYTTSSLGAGVGVAGDLIVGASATSNVGRYAILQGGVTNATNANYNITYVGADLTVDRRPVTVTANDLGRTYGAANPALTFTNTNLGAGIAIAGDLTVGADARSNVGRYAIGQGTVTNATNTNYDITYVGGILTIDPATITVAAIGGRSIYGQSPANPGLSAIGLQNGEDVGVLTGLTNSFGITNLTNAGRTTLNVEGGLTNNNYVVATRNSGEWIVDPAAITVTANGGRSIYGQSPLNPGISAMGLQNGEGVGVLTGLTNTFGITNLTGAGNHTLRVAGTLTNGNYAITARNDGIWAVNPAAITVTANGGRSTYGQSPFNPGISATGLQNGEDVGVLTGLANTFGITGRSNAGGYGLSVGGQLTNPNYVITGSVGGFWTVDRAALTVAASPQSRLVTELDPLLTYGITSGRLLNGDGFSGELARDRGDAPGNYAITQGSLAASNNYALTFVGSTFEIRALASEGPSQGRPNGPTAQGGGTGSSPGGGTTTISFQPASTPPVTFGSSNPSSSRSTSTTTAPTTIAAVNPVDPVTATVTATERVLTYLPISQFEAREYSTRALPGYEDRTGEATVLTMIARAIAGERTSTLFIDNFWNTTANSNAGATEFDLIAQRVTFSNGQGRKTDPEKAEPFALQGNDPAKLLQAGPLMIVAVGANGAQSWMLAIQMTKDGKGIIANDPVTGRQVTLAYDPEKKAIGGVTRMLDPKTNAWIAIGNADALKAAGLEITPERVAALQGFAPTGYLAVGVN